MKFLSFFSFRHVPDDFALVCEDIAQKSTNHVCQKDWKPVNGELKMIKKINALKARYILKCGEGSDRKKSLHFCKGSLKGKNKWRTVR